MTQAKEQTLDIRVFTRDDHAAALELWQAAEGVGLSDADSFENVGRFLERNPGLSFVATDAGRVVATILCGHDGRRGLIHHLMVAPSHRRRGLARALVKRALAALDEAQIQKCHLLVFRDNTEGLAFWHGIGAEERPLLALFSMPTGSANPTC
jgi:ribosomal protein S18 acetylase RimI-like enzyme